MPVAAVRRAVTPEVNKTHATSGGKITVGRKLSDESPSLVVEDVRGKLSGHREGMDTIDGCIFLCR